MLSNLPPGCTDAEIERRFGSIASCTQCGERFNIDEVGYDVEEEDYRCPKCVDLRRGQEPDNEPLA